MFNRKRKKYITVEEMNEHLKYCYNYYRIVEHEKRPGETFGINAFIEDKEVYFKLSYRKGTYACTYICRKDSETNQQVIDGGEAYRILSLYYKVPHMDESICCSYEEGGLSASPLLYKNDKYEGQRVDAIGYDLNSAYSWAMLKQMPDTSVPYRSGRISDGEIGFLEVPNGDKTSLVARFSGFATYIFPLMDSPFTEFVDKWYDKKVSSLPGSDERNKAKGVLNYAVGYLQRVNPFLRATIITYCNQYIKSLIDENTLYCNTDSIVTMKPIEGLPIGTGIGEFKIEHQGKFAYRGFNYQWNLDAPSYRGVSKSWFKAGWDILKDKLPSNGNIYEYKDFKLRKINHAIKSKKK